MIIRRTFLALFGAALLSACAATEPLLNLSAPSGYRVESVSIEVSSIDGLKGGRDIERSPAQIQADLTASVRAALTTASMPNGRRVAVQIQLDNIALVGPGQAFMVGGISSARGVLQVSDVASGEIVVPATEVFGTVEGWAPGGLIALANSVPPEQDYNALILGFASKVKARLFGAE